MSFLMSGMLGRPSWPTTRIRTSRLGGDEKVEGFLDRRAELGTCCGSVPSQRMSLSIVEMITQGGIAAPS